MVEQDMKVASARCGPAHLCLNLGLLECVRFGVRGLHVRFSRWLQCLIHTCRG
jgi:hypothetical protein